MIDRARRIGAAVARLLAGPAAMVLSKPERDALADLPAELVEINERLAKLEGVNDGKS